MKQVQINRRANGKMGQPSGLFALVDDADYDLVKDRKWCLVDGYASSQKTGEKRVIMHRLILGVDDPNQIVDHINRDRLDNQRHNLRLADRLLNSRNATTRKDSTSGHRDG